MLGKAELDGIRYLKDDIDGLERRLDVLYTRLEGLQSPNYNKDKGGQPLDVFAVYDEIIALQRRINDELKDYRLRRGECETRLEGLSAFEKKLITQRYFEKRTWREIAASLHYSVRHLRRLHYRVLKKLSK